MPTRRSIALVLISASWLGMIASVLYAIAVNEGGSVLDGMQWPVVSAANCVHQTGGAIASADWTPATQAALWLTLALRLAALWQVRRIGSLLLGAGDPGPAPARALGGLGLALAALAVAGFAFPAPEIVHAAGLSWIARQTPGFAGGLALGLGVIGAFTLAGLLRETDRLREENAGFV